MTAGALEAFLDTYPHAVIGSKDSFLPQLIILSEMWMDEAAAAHKGLHRVSRSLKIDCCSRLPLHRPLWISALKLLHVR